jgi:hypothetical protein
LRLILHRFGLTDKSDVDLHFMVRLDRAEQGLGFLFEIGEPFQSGRKLQSN